MGYLVLFIVGVWLSGVSPILFKVMLCLSVGYHMMIGIQQGVQHVKDAREAKTE